MTKTFSTSVLINSVQWIRSLREDEEDFSEEEWSRGIVSGVEAACKQHKMPFVLRDVSTRAEFEKVLTDLASEAAKGLRPLVHIDMHGGKDEGLEIAPAGECVAWSTVADLLRAINVAADYNLAVVSAACEGLHVISEVTITETCPFAILIAPEHPIDMDFLERTTTPFYENLLQANDIVAAHKAHLSPELTLFIAERQFARALAQYIRDQCSDEAIVARIDDIIAEAKTQRAFSPQEEVDARDDARARLEPSATLIDRFAPTFLGRTPSFTFDQLTKIAEGPAKQ